MFAHLRGFGAPNTPRTTTYPSSWNRRICSWLICDFLIVKLVAAEDVAEIGRAHGRIVDDLPWRALAENAALVDDQRAVAHLQRLLDIVISDQHALAELVLQPFDFRLKVLDGDRIDAAEWLIQQDQHGLGDQRSGDLQLSAFPAAEGVGELIAVLEQTVLVEQLVGAAMSFRAGQVQGFEDGLKVLPDGESLKVAPLLGKIADPLACPLVHGEVGDVRAVKGNRPAVGHDHPQDHSEGGGLSGSVAAEQADDLLLLEHKADLIDHGPAVVGLAQLGGFQQVHVLPSETSNAGGEKVMGATSSGNAGRNQGKTALWITRG